MSLRNSATGDLRLRTGLRDLTRRPFVLTFVALGTIELLRVRLRPQAGRPRGPRAGRPGRLAGHPRAGARRRRRGQPAHRGRVVRPDPARAVAVGLAGRDRRGHRRGAGRRHRRRPRRGRPPPARGPRPRGGAVLHPARRPDLANVAAPDASSTTRRWTLAHVEPGHGRVARASPDRRPHRARSRRRPAARPARDRRPTGSPGPVRGTPRAWWPSSSRRRPAWRRCPSPASGVARHARARRRRPAHRRPHRQPRRATPTACRNVLAAPLRVDGQTEGAIVVSRRTSEPWPASAHRHPRGRRRRRRPRP